MKKVFFTLMSLAGLSSASMAQFTVGTQFSYLTGHGKNDNHASLMGLKIEGQYALNGNMAIGSVVHIYKPTKSKYTDGSVTYFATDDVTNISASFEASMGGANSPVQPYVGADIGVSLSNHNVEYTNDRNRTLKYMIKQAYLMFSPKVGINVALSSTFGIFSQAQYNFSPGNGSPVKLKFDNAKSVTSITTEPISKYFNLDTGLYLKLGNIKKIL